MKIATYIFLLMGTLLFSTSTIQASKLNNPAEEVEEYEYLHPTVQNLSKMYWALDFMDINDRVHIDNYILMHECDIHKDYFHNEFEWRGVRESVQDFLNKNAKKFNTRFQFVQPLKLGRYNFEEKKFDVLNNYKMTGITKLELQATNAGRPICAYEKPLKGYPQSIAIKFSTPLILDEVPMSHEDAEEYIEEKLDGFRDLREEKQTLDNLYSFRDAYVAFKVKFFLKHGYERDYWNVKVPAFLAVLEKYEVYSDPELKYLLYEKTFRRKRTTTENKTNLIEKYQKQRDAEKATVHEETIE